MVPTTAQIQFKYIIKHHGFWANIQVNTKNLAERNILPQPANSCNKKTPRCKLPDAEKRCLLPHWFGSNLLAGTSTSRTGTSTWKRHRQLQEQCDEGKEDADKDADHDHDRNDNPHDDHEDDDEDDNNEDAVKLLVYQLLRTKKKILWIE